MAQGLGAPVGSIVAGPADIIAKVHRLRKMLGGGMRQAGVLAAPGESSLSPCVCWCRGAYQPILLWWAMMLWRYMEILLVEVALSACLAQSDRLCQGVPSSCRLQGQAVCGQIIRNT